MKQKLYYIKNETAEKAIYKNFENQRFSVIEKDSEPPMVLSFFDDKNVTDEYEYVYIPREMSKKEVEGRFEVEKQCPMCGTVTAGTATRVLIVGEAACRLRISKTYFRTEQKKNGN